MFQTINFNKKFLLVLITSFSVLAPAQEKHLKNIKQLTFGGDNAEAYFNPKGDQLTLQVTNKAFGISCDQIFMLDLKAQEFNEKSLQLVSTGKGRTTCSYYMPDGKHILYASTHASDHACPAPPKPIEGKYLWAIYPEFDIYIADLKGNITKQLTNTPGYDAEAVVSPDGKKIAFTSIRSGDLEIYTMDIDGSNLKQITNLGKANWAPYFHPTDKKIIFSSNHHSTRGYDFQLFMIDTDGENLQQITYESEFNAFPMFSPDGKKLVFSSNRMQSKPRETNVFIADWIEGDKTEIAQPKTLKNHISYLSSDELQGRLTGSAGEKKAAAYIVKEFKSLGLKPYANQSYLQTFNYKVKINPHSTDASSDKANSGTNVIAFLDNKASKTIVIGAHYDHLGLNEHNHSSKPNSHGEIHNGADDNASGVAAVLELARMFSQNKTKENVNYIFALFSGEEDGLIGSKHMAETLKSLYPNVVTMINLDMIGRLDKDKSLTVGGIGTAPEFSTIITKNKPAGFNVTLDNAGQGPSDHTSFYLKDIPVLFFFTGTHADYHKPSDDEDKINYYGVRNIVDYVFRVSNEIASLDKIEFTQTAMNAGKTVPKYKVTLGIMPDYTDHGDGLHIDGVTENRPAHAAGILEGDILVKIGDCEIKEVYGYMDCLAKLTVGDEKDVTVMRNGKPITMKVKF